MNGRIIIRSMSKVCSNTTYQDVSLDTWPPDVVIRWTQIAGIDDSSAPTAIQVGLKRSSFFYPFRGAAPGAADRSVGIRGTVKAPGDFVPCARFLGASSGDVLQLYVAGEIVS